MIAVHRLSAEIYEADFDLIALHSHLKDYALAYAMNFSLGTRFKRRQNDLDIPNHITIPIFEWKEDIKERYWTFFANRVTSVRNAVESEEVREKILGKKAENGLFNMDTSDKLFHMVPEYREADYFLKIEQDGFESHRQAENGQLIKSLQHIPKILMAYSVNTESLKSKNNLIF